MERGRQGEGGKGRRGRKESNVARKARSNRTKDASSVKRTRDEAVRFCYGCLFGAMKSVWTAPRVQFDPGFGVGIIMP